MKVRLVLPLLLTAGALGWILIRGLGGSLTYYLTPGQLSGRTEVGTQIRIGGQVQPGSVRHRDAQLLFVLQDDTGTVPVIFKGSVPAIFRSGQGAIVEGIYGRDHVMYADTLVVQHGNRYAPDSRG
ncbi:MULTISPECIES: cytochrome c maturation protein CcmE [unclassified Nonomuraea]|uniref:cytochrome c maturation protein CcmE n=1 Tax=unclassified Nonomuraea TaxID=2593643 RepID=UPI0033F570B3